MPSRKEPTLAEILYDAYRDADNSNTLLPAWESLPPEFQKAWERVADAAKDWAYEHIQWEE